jgi:hypothetical protein
MKIGPVGPEMYHADGRTDRQTDVTELVVAIRNFVKAPNIRAADSHGIGLYLVWLS